MKVFIFLFLLLFGLNATDFQKNQIFIGGALGIADIPKSLTSKQDSYEAFVWGMKGGYQMMFFDYVGFRTYLDYLMAIKPSGLDTITSSLFSMNADVLLDVLHIKENAFGLYGGVGFGYFQHANVVKVTPEDKAIIYGYTGVFNFGIGATIQGNHRVEIGAKIPFYALFKIAPEQGAHYRDIYASASYSYLF